MIKPTLKASILFIATYAFLMCPLTGANADSEESKIEWEITNRFSPFELTSNPQQTFARYRLNADQNWIAWYKDNWERRGKDFSSPYADSIEHKLPTHWDQQKQEHSEELLKFVKEEQSENTTVNISIRYSGNIESECLWNIGGTEVYSTNCTSAINLDIPLKGTTAILEIGGKKFEQILKPEHIVILGFGDSYGSGEGNPDIPASWKKGFTPPNEGVAWLNDTKNLEPNGRARWLDERCHRSFFSQQSLTALGIASKSKNVFVSFLHYACTGAEMFDGLLTPQFSPGNSTGYNYYSQLNSAIRELCILENVENRPAVIPGISPKQFQNLLRVNGSQLSPYDHMDKTLRKQRILTHKNAPKSGIANCPTGLMPRKPDMILLSIGGNDVGFADIVHYFIIPVNYLVEYLTNITFPKICPSEDHSYSTFYNEYADKYCKKMRTKIGYNANDLIGSSNKSGNIRKKYHITFQVIQKYLGVSSDQIYLTQYPDPLRTNPTETPPCAKIQKTKETVYGTDPKRTPNRHYHVESPWNALKAAAPFNIAKEWEFNLLNSEAEQLLGQFEDLRVALAAAGAENNVHVVCRTRDAFIGHGWWKGSHQGLPSHAPHWHPSDWEAYKFEENGRAVRTANDSYLTQAGVLNARYGSAHPNLLGHSLIADLVLEELFPKVAK